MGNNRTIRASQITELVEANHILFDQGVLDAFGHVSVRAEDDKHRFLLSKNTAPALVQRQDILEFDLDGETTAPQPIYLERFIHSEIYKHCPDVMGIVHSHSPSVIPFSVVERPLQAVLHMAGFLSDPTPVFEIRDVAGVGSDLLISNKELGQALAKSLGKSPVLLMRGHGSVAVGDSLKDAVYRAVYTELNAKAQSEALRLGSCTYLTKQEGTATVATMRSQIDRAWGLWRKEAESNRVSSHSS